MYTCEDDGRYIHSLLALLLSLYQLLRETALLCSCLDSEPVLYSWVFSVVEKRLHAVTKHIALRAVRVNQSGNVAAQTV